MIRARAQTAKMWLDVAVVACNGKDAQKDKGKEADESKDKVKGEDKGKGEEKGKGSGSKKGEGKDLAEWGYAYVPISGEEEESTMVELLEWRGGNGTQKEWVGWWKPRSWMGWWALDSFNKESQVDKFAKRFHWTYMTERIVFSNGKGKFIVYWAGGEGKGDRKAKAMKTKRAMKRGRP